MSNYARNYYLGLIVTGSNYARDLFIEFYSFCLIDTICIILMILFDVNA